jgi:hypothetical protein
MNLYKLPYIALSIEKGFSKSLYPLPGKSVWAIAIRYFCLTEYFNENIIKSEIMNHKGRITKHKLGANHESTKDTETKEEKKS